jgi:membrane protein
MASVAQRWSRRGRDLAETGLVRSIQLASVGLGKLTPRVQTRLVRAVQLAVEVHLKSREDQVSVYAAALTYNALLSILPLALVGLSLAGFLVDELGAPGWIQRVIEEVPGASALVQQRIDSLQAARTSLGVVGLVGALWVGSTLTSRAQKALDRIFGGRENFIVNRLRAIGVSIVLGALLLSTIGAATYVSGLTAEGLIALPLTILIRVAIASLMFGYWVLAYRLLTPTNTVPIRDHLTGALWMSIGFELLRLFGGWYVGRFVARASVLYGSIAALFGLMLFIRLAMWLFLYGAEISSILRDEVRSWSAQIHIHRHRPEPGDADREELVQRQPDR